MASWFIMVETSQPQLRRGRGYDLAGKVPIFTIPIQLTLRDVFRTIYKIDAQQNRKVNIVEEGGKIPLRERTLYGVLDEWSTYGGLNEEPYLEFETLDGFNVANLRCSQVLDYKVFKEDPKFRPQSPKERK